MSSLDIVRQLISDAIWAEADVSKGNKLQQIDRMEDRCINLETARVFISRRRLVVVIPEDLANAIQAEAKAETFVKDGVKMTPEVSSEHWSQYTPGLDDARYPLEDRIKLNGNLTPKAVEKLGKDEKLKIDLDALRPMMNKGAIDMHDKDCSADGALAEETDAKTKHFSPLDIIPCMAVKLPPDVIKLSRAVHACLLSPEHLSESVPAAPNISYQCSLPTIDGVKRVLTAGPNALACRYRPIVVGRLIDAPRRLIPMSTTRKDFSSCSPDSEVGDI